MKTTKRPQIALYLPKVVALLIVYGRQIVQAMTNNASFPSPTPKLATVSSDLDALEAAEVTAQSRAKGTAATRDLKKKAVDDDLMALKACVQAFVNQSSPESALAIIQSAGMSVRPYTARQKAVLAALMTQIPGQVELRAKAVGKHAAYEWQYSADGGKTWIAIGTTTDADTTVSGLTVGTTYLFRFRATVKKTTGDWTQLSFTVH